MGPTGYINTNRLSLINSIYGGRGQPGVCVGGEGSACAHVHAGTCVFTVYRCQYVSMIYFDSLFVLVIVYLLLCFTPVPLIPVARTFLFFRLRT